MTTGQVSVGGALVYAWTLLRTHWRAVWGVLALAALADVVYAAGQLSGQRAVGVVGAIAALVTSLMGNGALFRLALADRHPGDPEFAVGHQGLQWRSTEWRMLLASLLFCVFVGFLLILACLVLLAVLAGVLQAEGVPMPKSVKIEQLQAALGPVGFSVLSMGVAALVGLALYLTTRLTLVLPATVDAKAVRVLQTWAETRGRFWPIFTGILLAQLPLTMITGQIAGILVGATPGEAAAGAVLTAALIVGVPAGAIILPLTAGVSAYFHRAATGAPQSTPPPSRDR